MDRDTRGDGGSFRTLARSLGIPATPELEVLPHEPTTALDASTQLKILQLLKALQVKYEFSILLISHDVKIVSAISDKIVVLRKGEIVETGAVSEILNSPRETYTKSLLELL